MTLLAGMTQPRVYSPGSTGGCREARLTLLPALARAPANARRPRADAQHAQVPVMNAQVHYCA